MANMMGLAFADGRGEVLAFVVEEAAKGFSFPASERVAAVWASDVLLPFPLEPETDRDVGAPPHTTYIRTRMESPLALAVKPDGTKILNSIRETQLGGGAGDWQSERARDSEQQ